MYVFKHLYLCIHININIYMNTCKGGQIVPTIVDAEELCFDIYICTYINILLYTCLQICIHI